MLVDRSQWLLDPEVDFLNHGSFGACPREVLQVQWSLRQEMEREPVDFLLGDPGRVDRAVRAPARLLGVPAEELVFVDNTTAAVNAVLRSFDWRRGDRILTTTHAYDAVRNALRYVCHRHGLVLDEVPVPFPLGDPGEVVEAVADGLARGPRLVVVDHITSKTGLILPIREIVARCRAAGVPVLVDGAHVPGHLPVDVGALGADWYAGNLHKWAFAPKGCAVLHVRPPWQERIEPLVISHGYRRGLHAAFHWPGTRDTTAWLSAPAAVAFVERIGVDRLYAHNRALAGAMADRIAEAWGVARPAPGEMCGAMVTLPLPGTAAATDDEARRVHDVLRREGIEVPCFAFADRLWVRISAQAYNREADYDRLVAWGRSAR